jgi:phosphate transport system substrate-binding protein
MELRATALGLAAILAVVQVSAQTDKPEPAGTGQHDEMVEWLVPAVPTNQPQTDEVKAANRQRGRKTPEPEILQPTLDPALPDYQPRTDIALSGRFTGAASDVLPSLVELWIEGFKVHHPGVSLDVSPPYAGSVGTKELIQGNVDFVFVSRELKPEDIEEFSAEFGYGPLSVPICGGSYRHYGFLDAMGFFVHEDNPLERISLGQIDAIFSTTRHRGGEPITTWGQLGLTGEWTDAPIHTYGIKPWNGFEEFVRQRVLSQGGKRGEWRDDIRFDKLVFPVAGRVAGDRLGIGYSGLAFIDAGVRMLPLGKTEAGPFHAPTYENVARASYPLSRLIYFNTNKTPGEPLEPVFEELLRFILSRQGQLLVLQHAIYFPLRSWQVEESRAIMAAGQ